MFNPEILELPFFNEGHRTLHDGLHAWARPRFAHRTHVGDVDALCQGIVRDLGQAGWLR